MTVLSAGVTTHGSLSDTGNPHDAANAFAASSVLEMSPHWPDPTNGSSLYVRNSIDLPLSVDLGMTAKGAGGP